MTNTHEPWAKPKEDMLPWLHISRSSGLWSMTDLTSLTQAQGNQETPFPVRFTGNRQFPKWLCEPISPTKSRSETPKAGAAKDPEP
jgi:hypothetical protein